MPSLKGVSCSIELPDTKEALQEFKTIYNDGFVETFVAVPSKPIPFTVHLRSTQFIAPGLAMYVFIDGVYQCNRNRQDLKHCDLLDPRQSLVNFCVRQKEEKQSDGTMIVRDWMFEKLNIAAADSAPKWCSPDILNSIGCIEVVVLRCAGSRDYTSSSARGTARKNAPLAFGLDGASDVPDRYFGLDGQPRDRNTASTERGRRASGFGDAPPDYSDLYSSKSRRDSGSQVPSRPSSSHAKTIRSRQRDDTLSHLTGRDDSPSILERLQSRPSHKRYSSPVTPGYTSKRSLSPGGFRYGTGPVPHEPKVETQGDLFQNRTPGSIKTNVPIVNPQWLDAFVTDAIQRKLDEELRKKRIPETHSRSGPATPVPSAGAWPISPSSNIMSPTQDDLSDSWETSTWGTKNGHIDKRMLKSSRHWREPNTPGLRHLASVLSLVSESSDEGWEKVSPQSAMSGTAWSNVPGSTVMPPSVIVEVQNSTSGRRTRPHHREPQRTHLNNTGIWDASNDNSWGVANAEERMPSTSGTWGTINPVNPPDPQSIAARRQSLHDGWGTKDPKEPIPPPPTWGCAAPHKAQKLNGGSFPDPPPPYGTPLEALMRNASINQQTIRASSASSPWVVAKNDSTSPSWVFGGPVLQEHSSAGSSGWGFTNPKPTDSRRNVYGWADNGKNVAERSWVTGNDNSNTKNQSQPNTGWKVGGWETHGSNDSWGNQNKDTGGAAPWDSSNNNNAPSKRDNASKKEREWEDHTGGWKMALTDQNGTSDRNSNAGGWNNHQQDTPYSAAFLPKPSKAGSEKHSTTSPQHHKLAQVRSTDPGHKNHFKFPPTPSQKFYPIPEEYGSVTSGGQKKLWTVPEEPLLEIPAEKAEEKMLDHQVKTGKGKKYMHMVGRPKYIDSLEEPYAIFRFKYRSRSVLQSLLGPDTVPDSPSKSTPPSPTKELKNLSQDEIIMRYLDLTNKLKEKEGTVPKTPTLVNNWVIDQQARSREASLNGKKSHGKETVTLDLGPEFGVGWRGPVSVKGSEKGDGGLEKYASWKHAGDDQFAGIGGWNQDQSSGGGGWAGTEAAAPKGGW